jgi:hypothetical protein
MCPHFSLLLLALAAVRSSALWSTPASVDHKYNDLSSYQTPSNDTTACFKSCLATELCVGWVFMPTGPACGGANATCWLKSSMGPAEAAPCRLSGYVPSALLPQAFSTATVGTVAPKGWLKDELQVQATGLTGFLAHFWADIQNSSFIGGKADGGLHERTPYWLNGLVPASYLTQDANLVALREEYLGYIIEHQDASGWIGPDDLASDGNQCECVKE